MSPCRLPPPAGCPGRPRTPTTTRTHTLSLKQHTRRLQRGSRECRPYEPTRFSRLTASTAWALYLRRGLVVALVLSSQSPPPLPPLPPRPPSTQVSWRDSHRLCSVGLAPLLSVPSLSAPPWQCLPPPPPPPSPLASEPASQASCYTPRDVLC